MVVALLRGVEIDRCPVFHALLRDIEDIARRVMRGNAGERTRAWTLHHFYRGIFVAQARLDQFNVFHLQAEVIETRRAAWLARIDVESHITVPHGDGAFRTLLGRGGHPEQGLVEFSLQRILIADHCNVFYSCEHDFLSIPCGSLH